MSVIIRLQNLPVTAKSADIRNFFGGLRIPDGGVHILGGENGDAFIGFNSDEDARVAMRKDGGKVNGSRIKLFLSSRMEMQYEVEKITKCSNNSPSHKSYGQERTLADEDSRYISSERMISSQSSFRYGEQQNFDRHINLDPASQSPVGFGSRPRSRSPRKSRSSLKSQSNPKSPSPVVVSRRMPNYVNLRQIDLKQDKLDSAELENYNNNPENKPSTSEIQAELERRITEAIEKNSVMMARGSMDYQENNVPVFAGANMNVDYYPGHSYQEPNFPSGTVPNNFTPFPLPPPPPFNNFQPFNAPEFQPSHVMDMGQQHVVPPPIPQPDVLMTSGEIDRQRSINGFYVTISGLDPLWDFKEIHMMLNGIYTPQNNIRWETDDTGSKTGTAFVKLLNRDDFDKVVRTMTFSFNGRRITVSECPEFLSKSYFCSTYEDQNEYMMHQTCDLCYKLKGLPFSCTYEDVISFFQGFSIANIIIIYGKDSKATGIGFVSFSNRKDFEGAFQLNGKKINSHRYIEMIPSSERDMIKAKNIYPSAHTFTSYSQLLAQMNFAPSRRPLCAIITGLHFQTTMTKLSNFFADSGLKPDAYHITVNKMKECDGRAFVEFGNFREFDLALKLHGSTFKDNLIGVKQILYDEMIKILDTVKAKHHFETPMHASTSDLPEKVPYLWEPPDAYDEQDFFNDQYQYSSKKRKKNKKKLKSMQFNPMQGNPMQFNPMQFNPMQFNPMQFNPMQFNPMQFNPMQANPMQANPMQANPMQANPMQANPMQFNPMQFNPMQGPNQFNETMMPRRFPHNNRKPIGKKFDPYFKHEIVTKQEIEKIPSYLNQNTSFNTKIKDTASDFREPIKFNVNKPSTISTKTNKTFDSSKNVEKKSKLSKLSPEKEVSLHKEVVSSTKSKGVDFKKKTPERKDIDFKKTPEKKEADLKKNQEIKEVGLKKVPERKEMNFKKTPEGKDADLKKKSPERKEADPKKKSSERKEADPKKKSPERKEADPKKKSPERKEADLKKKSPERKDSNSERRNSNTEKGLKEKRDSDSQRSFKGRRDADSQRNFKERNSRIDKHYKSKDTFSRNHYERESKRSYDIKIASHQRSRSPVNTLYPERQCKECVLHFSNVSPYVGTPDLMEFLREFLYYKDTICRRYTDDGEPTGDVRVTFYNRSEAELAIRALNGRHLMGIRVNMFIP